MDRNDVIRTLQKIGAVLAEEHGFDNVDIGEDRQKGIWGEALTKKLEKECGPCTKEITWYGADRKEQHVQFRFRFANPRLCIRMPGEVLAELEIGDYNYEEKKHDGNFHIAEGVFWKDDGAALLRMLIERWYAEVKEHIKEEWTHGS